jgi:hypothetical protein
MDDRKRQMIEAYIPHPRDPSLEAGEYFFCQETMGGPRIIRVFALDILPHRDGTEYGIYQSRGPRLVRVDARGDGDPSRGVHMHELYDNKEDCRDRTHSCYDNWEWLREQQRKEVEDGG